MDAFNQNVNIFITSPFLFSFSLFLPFFLSFSLKMEEKMEEKIEEFNRNEERELVHKLDKRLLFFAMFGNLIKALDNSNLGKEK